MNAYALLGGHRQSTPDELRYLYYAIVRATHPDTNPDEGALFAEASKAWKAVGRIENRRHYDRYLDTVGTPCEDCDGSGALRHQRTLHDVTLSACRSCEGAGVTGLEGS